MADFIQLFEAGNKVTELRRQELQMKQNLNIQLDKICIFSKIFGFGINSISIKESIKLAIFYKKTLEGTRRELNKLVKEYSLNG